MKTYIMPNTKIVEIETSSIIAATAYFSIDKSSGPSAAEDADAREGEVTSGSIWGEEE